jgi:signal transduction histidine kinase/CheY-like chemotaxis protein/HPt (histidine-containing phosphotransfer) domain-containing protein
MISVMTDDLLNKIIEAIETLPEALALWDENDRLMLCNTQYRNLCPRVIDMIEPGVEFEPLLRKSVAREQFIIAGDREQWIARRLAYHRSSEGYFEQQLDSGQWVRMSERRAPWGGIISIRSDLTPLKQREQELRAAKDQAEAATDAKSRFLAVISHELRTPMNGILGLAQALARGSLSGRQQSYVETIITSARALAGLLDDMLDISRIEAGQLQVSTRPVPLPATLDEVVHLFEGMAHEKALSLRVRIADDVPLSILADPLRLRQILINLVNNAVKFTEAGFVEITAGLVADNRIRISVRDSGPGIDARDQVGLFQPFARIESSALRGFEGAGLGLAICKQLAEAMGGSIGVESTSGAGSVFWLELAAAASERQPEWPARHSGRQRALLDILVVDDDAVNILVAQALLEQLSHRVTVVDNGAAALRLLRARKFDVVLLDIAMPDEDGISVARKIRKLAGDKGRIPILAMTAKVMAESIAAYREAGMNGVVPKPIILEQLEDALSSYARAANPVGPERMRADVGLTRYAQILHQSQRSIVEALKHVDRFATDRDGKSLQSVLHRLGSTAGLLGFAKLADEAQRIELALEADHNSGVDLMSLRLLLAEASTRLRELAGAEQRVRPSSRHAAKELRPKRTRTRQSIAARGIQTKT